jgi:hypothetical protein
VADSAISGNTSVVGGGIYSSDDAEIVRSNLTGNYAYWHGGGIYSFGKLLVRQTTITSSETGLDGGAIRAIGDVLIDSSTLSGNIANRHGAGVWVEVMDGVLLIVNSTVSGNAADNDGGGVWITGVEAAATIAHSTIVSNRGNNLFGYGGGVFLNSGSLLINQSIVAKNTAKFGADLTSQAGTHLTARYSLIGSNAESGLNEAPDGTPDENGNLIGGVMFGVIDPKLGPLADNGGLTETHALLPGSPAINAGDLDALMGAGGVPLHDQRGATFIRHYGGRIDIGAFEVQPDALLGDYTGDGTVDAADFALWRNTKASATNLRADGNGDGRVDEADRIVWRANFGATRPQGVAEAAVASEPNGTPLKPSEDLSTAANDPPTAGSVTNYENKRVNAATTESNNAGRLLAAPSTLILANSRALHSARSLERVDGAEAGLMAWLALRALRGREEAREVFDECGFEDAESEVDECDVLEVAFGGWG